MSDNTVYIQNYKPEGNLTEVNRSEVMRYAGVDGGNSLNDGLIEGLLDEVIDELCNELTYRVCYLRANIEWEGDKVHLPFQFDSKDLTRTLANSKEVIMFAATIGIGIDRYIARNRLISPTKALLAQAYGTERVEKLCDVFCDEQAKSLAASGLYPTDRFSPGYGDLSLEVQRDFIRILDAGKNVGISLGESLLMTPSKSVTAVFGIGNDKVIAKEGDCMHRCDKCSHKDCAYRQI